LPVYAFEGHLPLVHPTAFVAEEAVLIGRVRVRARASVWFGAVVRADLEAIEIGEGSNVQDGAVLHADPGYPVVLGRDVTVGHRAVVHGARVEDGALIGIGAVVLNGAVIGAGAVVGAGALVPRGMQVPAGKLVLGVPARIKGEAPRMENARRYQALAARYREKWS